MTNSEMPYLPYAGTSGHSGSETSKARAILADRSGETRDRQQRTLFFLERYGRQGLTWKELSTVTNWHHGTASGVLSVLHKSGKIARLKDQRGKCKIYVLPAFIDGRAIEKPTIKRNSRDQIIREIQAFAGDYGHSINGRDVVIVDQLLTFLGNRNDR